MAFIIKPVVTEKMTQMTEKSSVGRTFTSGKKSDIEKKNAVEKKVSYVVKKKGKPDQNKEKTVYVYEKPARPRYGFIVRPDANKFDIKKEIESLYNVTVLEVNTMCYSGKRSRRFTRAGLIKGSKSSFKKAIVTLKEGDSIDFYSNI